jgi:hypothetical protein
MKRLFLGSYLAFACLLTGAVPAQPPATLAPPASGSRSCSAGLSLWEYTQSAEPAAGTPGASKVIVTGAATSVRASVPPLVVIPLQAIAEAEVHVLPVQAYEGEPRPQVWVLPGPEGVSRISRQLESKPSALSLVATCGEEFIGFTTLEVPFVGGLMLAFDSVGEARSWAHALATTVNEGVELWTIAADRIGALRPGATMLEVRDALTGFCSERLESRVIAGTTRTLLLMRCGFTMTNGQFGAVITEDIDLEASAILDGQARLTTIYLTGGRQATARGAKVGDRLADFIVELGEPRLSRHGALTCAHWGSQANLRACVAADGSADHQDRPVAMVVLSNQADPPIAAVDQLRRPRGQQVSEDPTNPKCREDAEFDAASQKLVATGDSVVKAVGALAERYGLRLDQASSSDERGVPTIVAECGLEPRLLLILSPQNRVRQIVDLGKN